MGTPSCVPAEVPVSNEPVLERILYVEDDPDIQAVARLALETVAGFRLLLCASGEEAVTLAPGFAPHLILLDASLPGMDGPATLVALRAQPGLARVPVVFLTAHAGEDEAARFCAQGAAGVLAKPFDPMTLGEEIRRRWPDWLGKTGP